MNLYRIMKHELIHESLAQTHFDNITKYEISYIAKLLMEGLDNNELTGVEREEIPFFSEIMSAAYFGIVRYSLESDGEIDLDKLQKVSDVFLPRLII